MTISLTNIDHVGIAVEDLEAEVERYRQTLGVEPAHRERVEDQGVEEVLFAVGSSFIQLLGSLGPDTPVGRSLTTRGPGIHHFAYRVEDVVAAIEHLRGVGAQLIDETPRKGSRNTLIAFVHPRSMGGVLVELVQERPLWWTWTGRTRPNVRCVIRRGDEILCAPAREPGVDIDFYYLPGGGIDFGERSGDALRREVREEIGQELTDVRLLGVLENTFTWTGDPHHTIEFVYEARVTDASFYTRGDIVLSEPDNDFPTHWRRLDSFDATTAPLYPEGLLELLRR